MAVVVTAIMLELLMTKNVGLIVGSPHRDGKEALGLSSLLCLSNLCSLDDAINLRYHVPRSWLKPSGNLLAVFEEWGGDPTGISFVKRTTASVCADIFEGQPALKNWQAIASGKVISPQPKAHLWCPPGQKISQIKFASFGMPQGTCGSFREGSCHAHKSYDAFERVL